MVLCSRLRTKRSLAHRLLAMSVKMKVTQSCRLFVTPWTIQSVKFSRSDYWSGYPYPSPGDLPNPGIKPGSRALHLYHLSHQGSPRILESVAYPFSSGSSPPRNRTGISRIAGGLFTNWATREAWQGQRLPNECWEWYKDGQIVETVLCLWVFCI